MVNLVDKELVAVALGAGTATIGKLAANSGVDIGDVTLTAGNAIIGRLAPNSGVDVGDVTLNASNAVVGRLAANSGVDIGDVGIERVNLANVTATIANGASLSDEIDLGGSSMQTILMPAVWTAASLTFQIAEASGGTWRNVYDDSGTEVAVTTAASRAIPMPAELAGARFIKIRSGTSGTPVNQGGARSLVVLLKG